MTVLLGILAILPAQSLAQDEPPAPESRGVRLQFLPPPMEGTISLGVYDAKGKLVRVLKREAKTDDFTVALNGLITFWDGKNDAGEPAPAGKYSAHGFLVGEFGIEGRAYHFNDWIADEKSPRISRIRTLANHVDRLVFRFGAPGEKSGYALCDKEGRIENRFATDEKPPIVEVAETVPTMAVGGLAEDDALMWMQQSGKDVDGSLAKVTGRKITLPSGGRILAMELPEGEQPIAACASATGGMWVIAEIGSLREVREYSDKSEFIRRLVVNPNDPQPRSISASEKNETIFLLEEDSKMQRVRALELVAPAPDESVSAGAAASTWKTLFEKNIIFNDSLDQVRAQLKMPGGKPFVPQEKVTIPLRANPLEQDKPGKAEVTLSTDEKGSYLKLADGLPLTHLTETPNLKWVAMARDPDGKKLTLFQSDGAVVEEFQVTKIANMMAFDCGEFDYTPRSE